MKQKDLALIVVIIFISAIVSIFISNDIFAKPSSRQQDVPVVQPIDSSLPTKSDSTYFTNGYDPTQLIQVGPSDNNNPFNSSPSQ